MRDIFTTALEVKEINETGTFVGLGSVYGNVDSYNDIVEKGAFDKSLATGRKVKMLWQHRQDTPIGIFTKTMSNDNGLYVEGQLNLQTKKGAEAYALLKQGALDGLSIGYVTKDFSVDTQRKARIIKEAELYEISLVTFPANEAATVMGVKSINEMLPKDIERTLRDTFNLSQQQVKAFMAMGYKGLTQRDVEQVSQRDAGESKQLADLLRSFIK